jgi:hypothetical protein
MGEPLAPLLVNCLHENFRAVPGGDTMMAVHAVRMLAAAPKDRISSEHADLVAAKVERGERGARASPHRGSTSRSSTATARR